MPRPAWLSAFRRRPTPRLNESGAFVFRAVVAVRPSAMEHVSLWNVFALRVKCYRCTRMSTRKRAWQRMSFLRSPSAKVLSLGQSRRPSAQAHGRGSRTATQVWFGIAVATVLTDSRLGPPRESLPEIPASPSKPRFGTIAHIV